MLYTASSIEAVQWRTLITYIAMYHTEIHTMTALIFMVLILHEFTNWTLFTILFSQIRNNIMSFEVGNSYY